MQAPLPLLLFKNINQSGAELQVLFWAFDLSKGIQLKSDVLQQIFTECRKENIIII